MITADDVQRIDGEASILVALTEAEAAEIKCFFHVAIVKGGNHGTHTSCWVPRFYPNTKVWVWMTEFLPRDLCFESPDALRFVYCVRRPVVSTKIEGRPKLVERGRKQRPTQEARFFVPRRIAPLPPVGYPPVYDPDIAPPEYPIVHGTYFGMREQGQQAGWLNRGKKRYDKHLAAMSAREAAERRTRDRARTNETVARWRKQQEWKKWWEKISAARREAESSSGNPQG